MSARYNLYYAGNSVENIDYFQTDLFFETTIFLRKIVHAGNPVETILIMFVL